MWTVTCPFFYFQVLSSNKTQRTFFLPYLNINCTPCLAVPPELTKKRNRGHPEHGNHHHQPVKTHTSHIRTHILHMNTPHTGPVWEGPDPPTLYLGVRGAAPSQRRGHPAAVTFLLSHTAVVFVQSVCESKCCSSAVGMQRWVPGGWVPGGWVPGGWVPGGWVPAGCPGRWPCPRLLLSRLRATTTFTVYNHYGAETTRYKRALFVFVVWLCDLLPIKCVIV